MPRYSFVIFLYILHGCGAQQTPIPASADSPPMARTGATKTALPEEKIRPSGQMGMTVDMQGTPIVASPHVMTGMMARTGTSQMVQKHDGAPQPQDNLKLKHENAALLEQVNRLQADVENFSKVNTENAELREQIKRMQAEFRASHMQQSQKDSYIMARTREDNKEERKQVSDEEDDEEYADDDSLLEDEIATNTTSATANPATYFTSMKNECSDWGGLPVDETECFPEAAKELNGGTRPRRIRTRSVANFPPGCSWRQSFVITQGPKKGLAKENAIRWNTHPTGNVNRRWKQVCKLPACDVPTTDNGPCHLPFTYSGKEYNACTSVDETYPWCQFGSTIQQWDYCKCETAAPTPPPTPSPTVQIVLPTVTDKCFTSCKDILAENRGNVAEAMMTSFGISTPEEAVNKLAEMADGGDRWDVQVFKGLASEALERAQLEYENWARGRLDVNPDKPLSEWNGPLGPRALESFTYAKRCVNSLDQAVQYADQFTISAAALYYERPDWCHSFNELWNQNPNIAGVLAYKGAEPVWPE